MLRIAPRACDQESNLVLLCHEKALSRKFNYIPKNFCCTRTTRYKEISIIICSSCNSLKVERVIFWYIQRVYALRFWDLKKTRENPPLAPTYARNCGCGILGSENRASGGFLEWKNLVKYSWILANHSITTFSLEFLIEYEENATNCTLPMSCLFIVYWKIHLNLHY